MATRTEHKFNPNSPNTHHLDSPQLGYLQIAKKISLKPLPQSSSQQQPQQQITNQINYHRNNNIIPKKRHNDSVTSTKSMPPMYLTQGHNSNAFSPPTVNYHQPQHRKNMSMPPKMNTHPFNQRTMSTPYGQGYTQQNVIISDEWMSAKIGGNIVRPTKDTYKEPLLDGDIDYGLETVKVEKIKKKHCCVVL